MRRAHAFVFPSIVEGFGLVLLESMAAGLPILATKNTGAPDIITDNKEGFLVPIRDADAIAERLTRLHADENARQEMGLFALRRAEELNWNLFEERAADLVAAAVAN